MHGQERIEQMGQPDPLRFRDQAEQVSIAVEAPGSARLDDFQDGLVIPIK